MKKIILILLILIINLNTYSQDVNIFTDSRDEKEYNIVTIGNQIWFAENLAFEVKDDSCWAYNNDIENVDKFGYLYNWEVAKDVCPLGWHLPTKSDFDILIEYVGGDYSKEAFYSLQINGEIGFNAILVGVRSAFGNYHSIDGGCSFWSSTSTEDNKAYSLDILKGFNKAYICQYNKACGSSVRCIKND